MFTIQPVNSFEKFLCNKAFSSETPICGTFELLPICNMDCKMCYIRMSPNEMYQQGTPLSVDDWLRIGKEAATSGCMFLLLTGGEPLLYPDFLKLYEGLRYLGIIITLNTNGTLIDKQIAETFKHNQPRRVNISLYGASDNTYKELCSNPKGFTQVMNGIHLLLDAGVQVKTFAFSFHIVIDNGQPWPQFSCVSYLSSPAVKVFVAGDFCALLGLVWRTII